MMVDQKGEGDIIRVIAADVPDLPEIELRLRHLMMGEMGHLKISVWV
jgi:hypothetical protein